MVNIIKEAKRETEHVVKHTALHHDEGIYHARIHNKRSRRKQLQYGKHASKAAEQARQAPSPNWQMCYVIKTLNTNKNRYHTFIYKNWMNFWNDTRKINITSSSFWCYQLCTSLIKKTIQWQSFSNKLNKLTYFKSYNQGAPER